MRAETPNTTKRRPPVIAVMGHIDHGKSTLIDHIRNTNITEKEAGGITQHISAYEIVHKDQTGREEKITFLDTPGHAAFQGIRTRGANAADIAILIVSAEDGVKPQTLEAYESIKAGALPFLVAITKIDKPSANVEMVKQSLAENGIYVEGYGGNIPMVAISAKTGVGVNDLLDMILLIADLENFTADEDTLGEGIIIESKLDPKKGITAIGIVKNGTVRKGTFAATEGASTPLRFILDAEGKQVDELTFSSPLQIIGWDEMPRVGATFRTFLKKDEAQEYAETEKKKDVVIEQKAREGVTYLPLVVKADTAGSLEAIVSELGKLERERIMPKVILSGIGSITENDVKNALATPNALVFGFNIKVDSQADALAERSGIPIKTFNIIYELTDTVKQLLVDREPRIEVEEVTGTAKILKIFSAMKDRQVVGARAVSGTVTKNAHFRIIRRDAEIGRGKIKELQLAKLETDTVNEGNEFGMMVESKFEVAPGDMLEIIVLVTK